MLLQVFEHLNQLMNQQKADPSHKTLQEIMPEAYDELEAIYLKLEDHYKDMQDIEFTIQKNKLGCFKHRTGKRTAEAAVRIAVEMVEEGLIDKETAVMRVEPEQLDQLLHPTFDPKAEKNVIAKVYLLLREQQQDELFFMLMMLKNGQRKEKMYY